MAGLLAWAADVVGGAGLSDQGSDGPDSIPLILTPDQDQYLRDLKDKAASLNRWIQDLRLRIPPSDISQRLPHLHAHSLASNAALALQLNAHSSTRELAQQREAKLLEENAAYEKEISNCQVKIQEKLLEAEQLQKKLQEMEQIEENLKAELEKAQAASSTSQPEKPISEAGEEVETDAEEASTSTLLEKLENKKQELQTVEERIQVLERKWAEIQDKMLKQPSPAQREQALDKQLHSSIEQLAAKQSQAEALAREIHTKEKELERLNGLWRTVKDSIKEANTARNRAGRNGSSSRYDFTDSDIDGYDKLPYHTGGRSEHRKRLRVLRSSFVIYIFLLHIVVFIKISL